MSQERYEYEKDSQLWEYEKRYKDGTDYLFRHDPDYYVWLEQRQRENNEYQREHE